MRGGRIGAAALAAVLACRDAPDPRVWASSALFLQRDTARSLPIDTTSVPEAALELLRTSAIRLRDDEASYVRFLDVRSAGRGAYEVDARMTDGTSAHTLRLIVECGSRHCLVIDTARI